MEYHQEYPGMRLTAIKDTERKRTIRAFLPMALHLSTDSRLKNLQEKKERLMFSEAECGITSAKSVVCR